MPWKQTLVSNGGTTTGFDPIFALVDLTSLVQGDRMTVVVMTTDNNPAIPPTPPANETWTLEASASMPIDGTAATSPTAAWVYGKDVSADDITNQATKTYQWTFGGAEEQLGILFHTDPATFGQFAKNEVTGATTTRDAPSVTTTVANELVYHCGKKDGGVAFTGFPSGDATRINEIVGATSGAGGALGIVEETYASPGATGAKTFTLTSEECDGFTFSLEPVALATYDQDGFQFLEDDAAPGSETAIAAEDTNIDRAEDDPFHLRVQVDISGDAPSGGMKVQYREVGDPDTEWRDVPVV